MVQLSHKFVNGGDHFFEFFPFFREFDVDPFGGGFQCGTAIKFIPVSNVHPFFSIPDFGFHKYIACPHLQFWLFSFFFCVFPKDEDTEGVSLSFKEEGKSSVIG